jgi:ABC-2 type transport system ATP-binding protein
MTTSDSTVRCHSSILILIFAALPTNKPIRAFYLMTLTDPVKVINGLKITTGLYLMQIDIHNLSKSYSEKRGLLRADFEVEKGELIAVIGHNGAGKSTLLNILASCLHPDSGQVLVDGINLRNRLSVVRKIGFVPETPNLFDFFSVEYNLKLFARLCQVPFHRIEEIMKELDLLSFRKYKIRVLSKGLRQRVSIARALLANPSVLLFDEPTSGIDFDMTKEIYRLLKDYHALGKTIIFTSHRPEEIKTLATRIIVLHQGYLVFDGSPLKYFQSTIHEKLYV